MAIAGWDDDELERGPQPEDEPIDAGHPAERFCLATPQGSVPSLPRLADTAAILSAVSSMEVALLDLLAGTVQGRL